MLYNLNVLVNWKEPKTTVEEEVKEAIEGIRKKYFGVDKPNVVKLENPRAKAVKNVSGYFEPMKMFPLLYTSARGDWQYAKNMPSFGDHGKLIFNQPYELMSFMRFLYKEDIEFIYFLMYHNASVLNGRIKIADDEAAAAAQVAVLASNLELGYQLLVDSSPIAKDRKLLEEVAVTFGVEEVGSLGINQIKNRIYALVIEGDKTNHRFINTKSFMELIGDEEKRRIAKIIYGAVKSKDLIYSDKDYGWHFVNAGKVNPEIIFSVAGRDSSSAVQYLINECTSNDKIKQDIYGYLGIKGEFEVDDFRNKTIHELRRKCKDENVPISNIMGKNKEELVEALCQFKGVKLTRNLL